MNRDYEKAVRINDEDGDMKVVGDSFQSPHMPEDAAEEEAKRFLLQKGSGNIEKAREAGLTFAGAIVDLGDIIHPETGNEMTMLETHHRLLLYSYIVNRVIAEKSPDNLLAQTSLGAFYSEMEAHSPHIYQHVSDMAAFSLYILSDRSSKRGDCCCNGETGKIYAQLCGYGGVQEKIDEGNNICRRLYTFCSEVIEKAGYKEL